MSPSDILSHRIAAGEVLPDAAQQACADAFDRLHHELMQARPGLLRRLAGNRAVVPRGIYLHGDVGRGKTMLMDMFHASVENLPKQRVHFHAFMQQVHRDRAALAGTQVVEKIAARIAEEARLLCLDEMQVTDIADAMIIGRLYEALEQRGVCLVTTSNVPPEQLYKDGLNRALFLPFIALLRQKLDVISLDGQRDYRLGRVAARDRFIVPIDAGKLDDIWNELTDHAAGAAVTLDVLGRKLLVPRAAHGCARFSFADLCESPLGPPDYLALAASFRTVFVDGIPVLNGVDRNGVKRFVLMIDTFYDAHVRLAATSAETPDALRPGGDHGFEFKRTVSRLKEMQGDAWWQAS